MHKPQKPVMPKKPCPPHKPQHPNSEKGRVPCKQVKVVGFSRPVVKPLVVKDGWVGRDTRTDFLRSLAKLLLICGISCAILYGLLSVVVEAGKGAMGLLLLVGIPILLLMYFKGWLPYLRSQVRRVNDFGWTGYASVILPLIVTCLLRIVASTCSVVSVTLLKVTKANEAFDCAEIGLLWGWVALEILLTVWLVYGCIVFPYLQDQRVDSELKGVAKVKEKQRIVIAFFVGAALGALSALLAFFGVVWSELIFVSIIGGIGMLCGLWSICVFFLCLFRPGKSVESTSCGS